MQHSCTDFGIFLFISDLFSSCFEFICNFFFVVIRGKRTKLINKFQKMLIFLFKNKDESNFFFKFKFPTVNMSDF